MLEKKTNELEMVAKQMESIKHASKTASSSLLLLIATETTCIESKNRGGTAKIDHDLPAGSVPFLWLSFPHFCLCSPWPAECVRRRLLLGKLSIDQTILDLGSSVSLNRSQHT
jgi:hypothetical protein